MLDVMICDDARAARGHDYRVPGLGIAVRAHADALPSLCRGSRPPALVFVDYSMGAAHQTGDAVVRQLRESGYGGRIVAISRDERANAVMLEAGADDCLASEAHLQSYLSELGRRAHSAR